MTHDAHSAAGSPRDLSYGAVARTHACDVASMLFLFVVTSVSAGRVWRFPFDDEIYTLTLIERHSALTLLTTFPASLDVHPPLSYLVFYGLRQIGLGEPGMRLCSQAMTALALALFQLLALRSTVRPPATSAAPAIRVIAVLLFGLTPLAISQGDALRWYPLFALSTALFVTLYLVPRHDTAQLSSAVALGLAASTNFLAALFVPAFVLYRYGLERRFCFSFDLVYWLLAAAGAGLGIYTAVWLLAARPGVVHGQFGNGVVRAVLTDTLGFFGGDALGLSQGWIVAPTVIVFLIAAASAIDRTEPGKPAHLLLLMLGATALMALAGFGKPRSFLFLAPIAAVLLTAFFNRQLRQGHRGRLLVLVALVLATSVSVIANVNSGTHPFKRNAVIPYQSILDFIHRNEQGRVLVVSTDPVVPWLLRPNRDDHCAGYFLSAARCLDAGRYDTVFVVLGHSDKSANEAAMRKFADLLASVTAGRHKVATLGAGLDEDAALKSRLTGVPLGRDILTIDYYQ